MARPLVYLCFFLSGFSGLVNEIVWSRLFVYTMGSSHLSITVVVSVFMGGLALGSAIGGRLADRAANPLRLYGVLVLVAGLLAALVVPLIALFEPLLGYAYRLHDGHPNHWFFSVVKAGVSSATILVPSTFMGATLPVIARHLTKSGGELGARLGVLYAVNTFGAVAGACAAGFVLLRWVGIGGSAILGAGVDVAVGLFVCGVAGGRVFAPRSPADVEEPRSGAPHAPQLASLSVPLPVRVAVLAFGISGAVNMALQLGWTRASVLAIGNSTYAFTAIVAVYIFGLAAGSWIAGLFADRVRNPIAAFGWLLVGTAVASWITIPWLGVAVPRLTWSLLHLVQTVRNADPTADPTFFQNLVHGIRLVVAVILPATLLMGMAFPLVGRIRVLDTAGVGRAVGAAYASNTIGAILGTALTGFFLIPTLERTWMLLYLCVAVGLVAGMAVLFFAPRTGSPSRRWASLAAVCLLLVSGAWWWRPHGIKKGEVSLQWHPVTQALGAYTNRSAAQHATDWREYAKRQIQLHQALYYRDGEAASVAVLRQRSNGHIMLNISGKTDASAGELSLDTQTQLLMGHLPLLVHPSARRALNLGLGGGQSLGAMSLHTRLESIDLLELCPEVVDAAGKFFAGVNHRALEKDRKSVV